MHSQRFGEHRAGTSFAGGHLADAAVHAIPRQSGQIDRYALRLQGFDLRGLTWANIAPNTWGASLAEAPKDLYFAIRVGGSPAFKGVEVSGSTDLTEHGQWYWTSNVLIVYAPTFGSVTNEYSGVWSNYDNVQYSDHHSKRNLVQRRLLYHPHRKEAIVYPKNPDVTLNYYHHAVRRRDVQAIKTLRANVKVIDPHTWDDTVITEIWQGGNRTMSMLMRFLETLNYFLMEPPPLGEYIGWCPFDRGFARHLIQPLDLKIGPADARITEIRENQETGLDAYSDQQVSFSFALVKGLSKIDSHLISEGF